METWQSALSRRTVNPVNRASRDANLGSVGWNPTVSIFLSKFPQCATSAHTSPHMPTCHVHMYPIT